MSVYQIVSLGFGVGVLIVGAVVWFIAWDLHTAKTQLKALDRHNDR